MEFGASGRRHKLFLRLAPRGRVAANAKGAQGPRYSSAFQLDCFLVITALTLICTETALERIRCPPHIQRVRKN